MFSFGMVRFRESRSPKGGWEGLFFRMALQPGSGEGLYWLRIGALAGRSILAPAAAWPAGAQILLSGNQTFSDDGTNYYQPCFGRR
jgi:hypothetical protein